MAAMPSEDEGGGRAGVHHLHPVIRIGLEYDETTGTPTYLNARSRCQAEITDLGWYDVGWL